MRRIVLGAVGLAALATLTAGRAPAPMAKGWITTIDGSQKLQSVAGLTLFHPSDGEAADVTLFPAQRYQSIGGFGAAVTDASAYLIQTKLNAKQRNALLTELFSRKHGMGFSATRLTIGASDFSQSHYTYADTPGNPMADITPARAHVIPTVKAMQRINPKLIVMASPWSAPAWMKSNNNLIQGQLDPAHYGDFARYLVSYTKVMGRAGVKIDYLTIQNEPHFEPKDYPGMRVEPAERAAFVGGHLGPLMDRETPKTKLLDWDHNWDEPQSPTAVLSDANAARFIDGVAWHCYAGEVAAQSPVHDAFPTKETWMTECSAGTWSGPWRDGFAWSLRNLVIGAVRNHARGSIMWNLALDENNGPHLGGCGTCRGLVTINSQTGAITREPEYYAFAHASLIAPPGSTRIGSESKVAGVETVAFQQGRRGPISVIVYNGSGSDRTVRIAASGARQRAFVASMPAGAAGSFIWKP